ncbi:hypothetical protein HN827_09930, partial [archaeon]|nr:hypothetical protein [archaeon]
MNKKILVFSILFITLINLVGAQTYTCAPDGKTVSKDGNIAIKFCGSVEQSCSNGECIGNPCPGFETSCSSDEKWRFAKCSSSVDFGIYENCDQQGKTCINGECVGEPQIECGTITKNIVLTKNLVSEDTCFTIGADNIVIDGNGYSITGNENGNGVFSEDHSSITIKNLKINNFKYGIELKKSSNSEIYNNNIIISGNYASGIKLLTDSAQNNIHDNEIIIENEYSSARYGIHVENSENNNIKKNTISTTSKNVGGILLKLTSNNIIEDNIISLEGSTLNRGAILFADANNNIINNNDLDSKSDFEIYMSHVSSSGDLSGNRFSKVKIHNTIISSDNFYYSSMKNEDPQSLPNIEGVKLSDYLYISSFNTNPGHIDFNIHYDPSGIDENTIILYYLDSETNSWESFSTSTIDKEKNIISSGLIQFPFISKSYIHVVLIGQEIENQVCPNDCTNGCLNGECIIDELSCTPDNIRETVQSGDYKVAFNTYNRQHPLNSNPLIDSIVTFINVTYLGDKVETKLVYLKMECPKTDKYPNGFSSEPSYWFETLPNQTVIINGPSYTIPLDETLSRNCKFSFRVDENILVVNECIHAPPFDEDASCIDNDGLDMATKGTTKKSPYTYTDYCGFRGILREYSCTGNTVRTTVMTTCEINCVDGKCISSTEPTCTDADLDSYESSSCGGEDCDDTNANIFPGQSDLCDDIDNDCDNAIDEDCICIENEIISCGETNLGECEYGTQYCTNNAWGDCTNYIGSENEICDGLDNNCDGTIDEGCDCTNGEIISCGDTNLGICTIGQQTCTNGVWSECQGLISPSEEFCDNIDNNCDGVIDDNCKCIDGENKACGTSDIGI